MNIILLQALALVLPFLSFIFVTSVRGTAFSLDFEILLASLAGFSMIADLGFQTVFSKNFRELIRLRLVKTIYALRLLAAVISSVLFFLITNFDEGIKLSPSSIGYIFFVMLYFTLDFAPFFLFLRRLDLVHYINILKWLGVLSFVFIANTSANSLLIVFIALGICGNLILGYRFFPFLLEGKISIQYISSQLGKLGFFNLNNIFNIIVLRFDIIFVSKFFSEELSILYVFLKKFVQAASVIILARSKLLLVFYTKKSVEDETKLMRLGSLFILPFIALAAPIGAKYFSTPIDIVSTITISIIVVLTFFGIREKSILQNNFIYKRDFFNVDLYITFATCVFSGLILVMAVLLDSFVCVFLVRLFYEWAYIYIVRFFIKRRQIDV